MDALFFCLLFHLSNKNTGVCCVAGALCAGCSGWQVPRCTLAARAVTNLCGSRCTTRPPSGVLRSQTLQMQCPSRWACPGHGESLGEGRRHTRCQAVSYISVSYSLHKHGHSEIRECNYSKLYISLAADFSDKGKDGLIGLLYILFAIYSEQSNFWIKNFRLSFVCMTLLPACT